MKLGIIHPSTLAYAITDPLVVPLDINSTTWAYATAKAQPHPIATSERIEPDTKLLGRPPQNKISPGISRLAIQRVVMANSFIVALESIYLFAERRVLLRLTGGEASTAG